MTVIFGHDLVPTGSLYITKDEAHLEEQQWRILTTGSWMSPGTRAAKHGNGLDVLTPSAFMDSETQKKLLRCSSLSQCGRLLRAGWVQLHFRVSSFDQSKGMVRVYILPDDVERRTVDRDNPGLWKARGQLLQQLDFSTLAWHQGVPSTPVLQPLPFTPQTQPDDENTTLLQLFNQVPAPSPDPDLVSDPYIKDAMTDLQQSTVPGLTTKLYPYQRRSAALMLQKEAQPGMILDPRLLHLRDPEGKAWYLDPVTKTVLKEPRYYDGISGGILAEEMGLGKTIICLALILSSRHLPTKGPEIYGVAPPAMRQGIASLADMAASCTARNGIAWRSYLSRYKDKTGDDYQHWTEILERNPGFYEEPAPEPRRVGRGSTAQIRPPEQIYLSSGTVIIVPNNLVAQWKTEIAKHTSGLSTITFVKNDEIPGAESLIKYDVLLFSQGRFEKLGQQSLELGNTVMSRIHFKRCIVDEGHKIGNTRMENGSLLLAGVNSMRFSSRWIVTGTPTHGLYGADVETSGVSNDHTSSAVAASSTPRDPHANTQSALMERKDLEKLGSMAALYLKMRPWANTAVERGDSVARWKTYLMLPKHDPKSHGRWENLRSTLDSLIIRHPRGDVDDHLPPVNERIIVLEGSYQDRLSLNIFAMMLIFNAVQSQRTDMDYFFHPKQRKSLLQVVSNLKQSSFFGGSFFSPQDIQTSIKTAEEFLEEKKIPISEEDEKLLREALALGKSAAGNRLRELSNQFHEIPVHVEGFPAQAGEAWSLGHEGSAAISTCSGMLTALQKLFFNTNGAPEAINALLNGGLAQRGVTVREDLLDNAQWEESLPATGSGTSDSLAGNTRLGEDKLRKNRSHGINGATSKKAVDPDAFKGPLELTKLTATSSAKLSYLIDSIVQHQDEDKIIVFYENENVAWYLAGMLDVLQIQHLIYAKGISNDRRAQYVRTFHHNDAFRVLLMDLSQAAFGLDMREASRVYFINPVLNPQVEAQAIGRVRRIHQKKTVHVETLMLKDSIDEVILERKQHMTQAEHRQAKSILDIQPIYNWIKNIRISPLPNIGKDDLDQMVKLKVSQHVFGKGFGQQLHPDDGLVLDTSPPSKGKETNGFHLPPESPTPGAKRSHEAGPGGSSAGVNGSALDETTTMAERPARRLRFAGDGLDGS